MSRFLVPFQSPSRALGNVDPFSELHREMNRLFDDFMGGGSAPGPSNLMAMPRLDVREGQNEIAVCMELPGVKPSDVDVRIEGNVLTVRGEKKNEFEQQQQDYHVTERSFGRFQRSLQLPFAPNADQLRADFEDGVLTVHIPKQPEQERSRRVEIQSSGAKSQPQEVKQVGVPGEQGQGQGQQRTETTHH